MKGPYRDKVCGEAPISVSTTVHQDGRIDMHESSVRHPRPRISEGALSIDVRSPDARGGANRSRHVMPPSVDLRRCY